jgi:hypothetical protein
VSLGGLRCFESCLAVFRGETKFHATMFALSSGEGRGTAIRGVLFLELGPEVPAGLAENRRLPGEEIRQLCESTANSRVP